MTGAVFEVRSTRMAVAAHLALMESAILLAVKGIAHIIELIDVFARAFSEIFHCILVAEIVAALDGIKDMGFNGIRGVAHARNTVHAALCHRGCGAGRNQLRHHGYLELLAFCCRERRPHAGTAAADDQNIIGYIPCFYLLRNIFPIPGKIRAGCQHNTGRCRPLDKCAARNFRCHIAFPPNKTLGFLKSQKARH